MDAAVSNLLHFSLGNIWGIPILELNQWLQQDYLTPSVVPDKLVWLYAPEEPF